jgi:hypothetical protein
MSKGQQSFYELSPTGAGQKKFLVIGWSVKLARTIKCEVGTEKVPGQVANLKYLNGIPRSAGLYGPEAIKCFWSGAKQPFRQRSKISSLQETY